MKGHPGRSVCMIDGCGKMVHSHGYCQGHWCQVKTHGQIVRVELGLFEKKICSVPGCGQPYKARGYCSRHTYQYYEHGRIISAEKLHDKDRKCSVPSCGRNKTTKIVWMKGVL